jgi:hypothetical protein
VKAIHDLLDALVDESVMRYVPGPVFQLLLSRQHAVQQKVSELQGSCFSQQALQLDNLDIRECPLSPSMKVIRLLHEAVFMKAGS